MGEAALPLIDDLHRMAEKLPSQGGVEIGAWLERYAARVPDGSAIVELGSWLGGGTTYLGLGAKWNGSPIYVYDRWKATRQEVDKAAKYGIELKPGQNTLPLVQRTLRPFYQKIFFQQGDIRQARWNGRPIGLYVDDATKVDSIWRHAMQTFKPSFIPGETIVVLMDYHFDEKAGENYAAQKRYMADHSSEFELLEERMAGTTVAVFRYLGC